MWALSKHSRQTALEHSRLQEVVLQRTAELQTFPSGFSGCRTRRDAGCLVTCTTALAKPWAALKNQYFVSSGKLQADPSKWPLSPRPKELTDQAIQEIRTMSYFAASTVTG